MVKISCYEVAEKSSSIGDKNLGSAGLVRPPFYPCGADRAQNFVNVVDLACVRKLVGIGCDLPESFPKYWFFSDPQSH